MTPAIDTFPHLGLAIPHGYCQCGCGQKTTVSQVTVRRNGYEKGVAKRFVRFHQSKRRASDTAPVIYVDGEPCREIALSKGKSAIVDVARYEELSQHTWFAECARGFWYAGRHVRFDGVKKKLYMHHAVLQPTPGLIPDHRNGNGLDNRLSNLRPATVRQNVLNSRRVAGVSGYRGVCFEAKARHPWRASIKVRGKKIHLGLFDTPREAAVAYNEAAKVHNGEFACLNNV